LIQYGIDRVAVWIVSVRLQWSTHFFVKWCNNLYTKIKLQKYSTFVYPHSLSEYHKIKIWNVGSMSSIVNSKQKYTTIYICIYNHIDIK
jgi:hypothetical protein